MRIPNLKNPAAVQAFGRHLCRLRQSRGWSQQALADVADVSKPTIFRIEHGRGSPTLDLLVSLAHGLEIPLSELVHLPTEAAALEKSKLQPNSKTRA